MSLEHDIRSMRPAKPVPGGTNRPNIHPHDSMNNPDARKPSLAPTRCGGINVSDDWIDVAWKRSERTQSGRPLGGPSLVHQGWANGANGYQRTIEALVEALCAQNETEPVCGATVRWCSKSAVCTASPCVFPFTRHPESR